MTLKWQRLVLVLVLLALVSNAVVSSDQQKPSRQKGNEAKKTDVHGDPLPESARVRMGTLRWRHPANIAFVGFTAQKQVVTGCGDGFFRVWDADSGKEIRKFGKPGRQANNWWGGGEVMRLPGGGVRSVSSGPANTVALSADGKLLAEVSGDRTVRVWDVAGGKETRHVEVPVDFPQKNRPMRTGVAGIALSPDAKTLATRDFDQVIRLWDTSTGKQMLQIGKADPLPAPRRNSRIAGNSLAFLADGKSIVSAGIALENQRVVGVMLHIYDVKSGKELKQIRPGPRVFVHFCSLAVLPKSNTIAWTLPSGQIGFYDADSGKEIRKIGQQTQNIYLNALLFSADGKIMATRKVDGPTIYVWDVASGKELRHFGNVEPNLMPGSPITFAGTGGWANLAFSPDGKTLVEGTVGNTVRLWNMASGKEIAPRGSGHHGDVNRLAVFPGGKVLTTFASDYSIRQWDMATGKELRQVKVPATAIGLSGDGKLAAWSTGAKIKLWDTSLGKEIRTIDLPEQKRQLLSFFGMTGAPAISANGKWLAMRGPDQIVHIVDTTTGKQHRRGKPVLNPNPLEDGAGAGLMDMPFILDQDAMAFSADGAAFAASSSSLDTTGGRLRLWNLTQRKNPRRFESEQQSIGELAVTPDARYVITASDSHITLWESLTGKECLHIDLNPPKEEPLEPRPGGKPLVMEMQAPGPAITALAISPDGRTLAAALDRSVHLIDLRTGKVLGQYKGHNGTVTSVTFAADNQTVISGSADTTALVWDGSRLIKNTPSINLNARQVDDLWKDLAGDPEKAYRAIGTLSAAPKQTVALVKEKVKPPSGGAEKRIQNLLADLESDMFQVRQTASKELEKLGEAAEHALQKSIQTLKTLEAKRRVQKLLDQITDDQTPTADVVRTLRAVQILENLGTSEARTELERLAKGAPGDKLTRSADSALRRLGKNR